MKKEIEEFFQLTLDEKISVAKPPDNIEGYGQHFVLSEDQKLDWGEMFFLFTQPVSYRNMRFWPTHPHTFRDTLDAYSVESKRVRDCLLELIGRDLVFVPEKFTDLFKEGSQDERINYYPPCPYADKVLGLSPHSDSVGLTLLLQVNEVQGMQINRNGRWISIKPLSSAFVVNIGDILEIMSNEKYKSIEHRAIINTERTCIDELEKYRKPGDDDNGDIGSFSTLFATWKKGYFMKGDAVIVVRGDLKNLMGWVEKVEEATIYVRPKMSGLPGNTSFTFILDTLCIN